MKRIFFIATLLFSNLYVFSSSQAQDTPSWYIKPKQNNSENLYGVADGASLEEATRFALADAAARLMVSISSESNLTREENRNDVNEEMRQKVRQNIEKINFSNFKVTKSDKLGERFFVETEIERSQFLNEQRERLGFIEKQIADLDKNSLNKSPIQRRYALIKILDLEKEVELKAQILAGAGQNINLKEKLAKIAEFKNQLNLSSDKIEFYFDENSPKEITKIIRNSLNKEKIKISQNRNISNPNQIILRIKTDSRNNKIYEAFMTKLEIDFENLLGSNIVASNSIEVSGSSTLGEKEAYLSSLKSLEELIEKEGILKILGITN